MKEVKVMPKFKCDFCKKRGKKATMIKHEVICWYNPNRKCITCDDKGYIVPADNCTDNCPDCEIAKKYYKEIKRG